MSENCFIKNAASEWDQLSTHTHPHTHFDDEQVEKVK